MSGSKPVLVIRCFEPDRQHLKEVMAGLEEEGVLYRVDHIGPQTSVKDLAMAAAQASSLGVGIGIWKDQSHLAIREQVAPRVICQNINPRIIGQNGARYIKKKPLR